MKPAPLLTSRNEQQIEQQRKPAPLLASSKAAKAARVVGRFFARHPFHTWRNVCHFGRAHDTDPLLIMKNHYCKESVQTPPPWILSQERARGPAAFAALLLIRNTNGLPCGSVCGSLRLFLQLSRMRESPCGFCGSAARKEYQRVALRLDLRLVAAFLAAQWIGGGMARHGFLIHPASARGRCPACDSVRWAQSVTYRECWDCGYRSDGRIPKQELGQQVHRESPEESSGEQGGAA
jgi:Zn ribbon nucleic-acid-binding protein